MCVCVRCEKIQVIQLSFNKWLQTASEGGGKVFNKTWTIRLFIFFFFSLPPLLLSFFRILFSSSYSTLNRKWLSGKKTVSVYAKGGWGVEKFMFDLLSFQLSGDHFSSFLRLSNRNCFFIHWILFFSKKIALSLPHC